jgi:phage anti-repressor protein/phage antirepressor YoqD-like protein
MAENFTLDLAKNLYFSDNDFPVDFDVAWEWLGYSRKDHGKTSLLKSGFVEGIDYQILLERELRPQGGFTNRECISLTVDCLKHWAMMSGTEMGKQVRLYFLECEKIAKRKHSQREPSRLDILEMALDSEKKRIEAETKLLAEQEAKRLIEAQKQVVEKELEEAMPLVHLGEMHVIKCKSDLTVTQFSGVFGKLGGRNKTFSFLRDIKFIQQENCRPYRSHVNAGRAYEVLKERKDGSGKKDSVTVLTVKGQEYIAQKYEEFVRFGKVELEVENIVFNQPVVVNDDF